MLGLANVLQLGVADTPVRGTLSGHNRFFDCTKAERVLGWRHEDERDANH